MRTHSLYKPRLYSRHRHGRISRRTFSRLLSLLVDPPIAQSSRLSLAVLVDFTSLPGLLLYLLPSSPPHLPIAFASAASVSSQVLLCGKAICLNKAPISSFQKRTAEEKVQYPKVSIFEGDPVLWRQQQQPKVSGFSVKPSV